MASKQDEQHQLTSGRANAIYITLWMVLGLIGNVALIAVLGAMSGG